MTRRYRYVQASAAQPIRIGVSACLLGQAVRWDGRHKRDTFLSETLAPHVEFVPVCPEVELGLGIPREPIRLEGNVERPRLVAPGSGKDHTRAMRRLARARVEQLARMGLSGYVLKARSPTCGMERVAVHPPRGGPNRRGTGLFARALRDRLPLLPVEEEGHLEDPGLRESFIERVFAYARWKELRARRMTRARLLAFHAAHELVLLAHDPAGCRRLGALVAGRAGRPLRELVGAYEAGFMDTLRVRATPARHARILERLLERISAQLTAEDRRELVSLIAGYRRGLVPLAVTLARMRHHVRRLGIADLGHQVYLDPDAKELRLREPAPRSPTARRRASRGARRRRRSSP